MSVREVVGRQRLTRLVEFGAVGATGVGVDLAVVVALTGTIHYVAVQVAAWLVAATWNYALNYRVTFDQPGGSHIRLWSGYLGSQTLGLAVRTAVVVGLVEWVSAPVLAATACGVAVGALANYAAAERVMLGEVIPNE